MSSENNGCAKVVLRTGNVIKGPKHDIKMSSTLGKFIWDSCDTFAQNICQISSETGESETFYNYKSRATTVAIHMRNLGIKKGDVTITCTPNTLDSSLPATSSLFLGAITAALDPTLSTRECTHLISLVKPKMIFTDQKSLGLIKESLMGVVDADAVVVVFGHCGGYKSFAEFLEKTGEEDQFEPEIFEDTHPSHLLFSSGTTGLPKAICLSQKSVYIGSMTFQLMNGHSERTMHFTTFYWISAVMLFIGQFYRGCTRVLINEFDPDDTLVKIAKYKVTCAFMASSYGYKITHAKDSQSYDLSCLKYLYFGGSPLGPEQLNKIQQLLPETYVSVGYGLTEISGFATAFLETEKELAYANPSSCGRPVMGLTIKIVDPETEKSLSANKSGEIRIKSDAMMIGYYNQDCTSAFDSKGYLKTGDIGHYDENCCIYVYDRIKDMFKYQCWHIVPASIENVVLEHPDVQEAVIFGVPHEEDEHLPAAAIKLRQECSGTTADDIEKFVAERVIDRQRLRGGVFIVEDIPKTPSQKVLRRKVQQMILQRLQNINSV